ncbi:MAG: hypothetical protein RLZZ630_788 [Bacteroidota bacterium]|jgi:hypothetical protein
MRLNVYAQDIGFDSATNRNTPPISQKYNHPKPIRTHPIYRIPVVS